MKSKPNAIVTTTQQPAALSAASSALPSALVSHIEQYPENSRRPVNKTVFRNEYFQLTYNVREQSMAVSSRGDIVYSAIPYDTARNYIQRGAIQYLLYPEEVRKYIESHKADLEKYLTLSIFQVTGKRVEADSFEVIQAYQAIFQNPLFEIQILGRLLQHDETGPLSANLAGKFLFSENVKTGISEYVSAYLNFVVQLTQTLPITTDGKQVQLLEGDPRAHLLLDGHMHRQLTIASDIQPGLAVLPQPVKETIEHALTVAQPTMPAAGKPLLRSEFGNELADVRNSYIAHSVHPQELEHYFTNVLPTENTNRINVLSDAHARDGKLPFVNQHFNILAGDMSDSHVTSETTKGVYVIGGHDLLDVLPASLDQDDEAWAIWRPFTKYKWFKELLTDPEEAWFRLPIGDHPFYDVVKTQLSARYPDMYILHNSSVVHEGVRYIGLTIPAALVKRRKQQQAFILKTLEQLLGDDDGIPTVIVSHAPLFNELSMLSPRSSAYNKGNRCEEPQIEVLFESCPIMGVIHGHHHIPASSGRYKMVSFAGKERFVVCSIYSHLNTGFELTPLLKSSRQELEH